MFGAILLIGASASAGAQSPWPEDWLAPSLLDEDRWQSRRMGPRQKQRLERHDTFMGASNIAPYADRQNPLPANAKTVDAGAAIYGEFCGDCHGSRGFGDGDAGLALDPSPALLAFMVKEPRAVDGYLMWSIAEGGGAFSSEMPAFKGTLTETQIWQVIAYLRAGLANGAEVKE